jgi:hypothetical protein
MYADFEASRETRRKAPHANMSKDDYGTELFSKYASTVSKLSDEALMASHRENLRSGADELIEITRAELERRGLPKD